MATACLSAWFFVIAIAGPNFASDRVHDCSGIPTCDKANVDAVCYWPGGGPIHAKNANPKIEDLYKPR